MQPVKNPEEMASREAKINFLFFEVFVPLEAEPLEGSFISERIKLNETKRIVRMRKNL